MNKCFFETPFGRWLIFYIDRKRIERVVFSDKKMGLPLSGEIKGLVQDVFNKKDLSFFDYSLINFDKTKKAFILYKFLINTRMKETFCYSEVAKELFNSKNYARSVAKMLSANRFIFLVPCHRVVAKTSIGGYAYGVDLKTKLLTWEGSLG